MTLTTRDDGVCRTHDEARDLLAGVAAGARLHLQRKTARSAGYELHVRRWGAPTVCVVGSYTLPAPADRLAANAREQLERATR